MQPSTGGDERLTVVVESNFLVLVVEAVGPFSRRERILVPVLASHDDPGGGARVLDGFDPGLHAFRCKVFIGVFLVERIGAVPVGHNPGNSGLAGRPDELVLRIWRRGDGHGDEEELLALEGVDEALLVVVVDVGDLDVFRERALAAETGDGGEGVLAGLHDFFGDVLAYLTAGLEQGSASVISLMADPGARQEWRLTPTIATRSMLFEKPAGWFFAYSCAILISMLESLCF